MQDDSETLAEFLQILFADVDTVDKDGAALDVVEAHHQAGDGGFACAGVADDGCSLVGFDDEADAAKNPLDVGEGAKVFVGGGGDTGLLGFVESLIGEPDVAEFDAA